MSGDASDVPRVPAGSPEGGQWTAGAVKKMTAAREARTGMADMFDRLAKPDGGFTYQPMLENEPATGYAVSTYPERSFAKGINDLSFDDFVSYAQRNQDLLSQAENHLGAWHDPETGKAFLDVSRVTQSEREAASLARAHDQIAYFDLSRGRSVTINRNARSGGAAGD